MLARPSIASSNNYFYPLARPVYIVYFLLIVFELGLVPEYGYAHPKTILELHQCPRLYQAEERRVRDPLIIYIRKSRWEAGEIIRDEGRIHRNSEDCNFRAHDYFIHRPLQDCVGLARSAVDAGREYRVVGALDGALDATHTDV